MKVTILLVSQMDEPNIILGVFDDSEEGSKAFDKALLEATENYPQDSIWGEGYELNK